MDEQFPRNEFEALIGHLKQFLGGANDPDGEETLLLSEVDEVLLELGQLGAPMPTVAQRLEKPLDQWVTLRTNEASDETLLSELEFMIYDLENLSDELEQGVDKGQDGEQSKGVFDSGLQVMLGKLAELPDRGVVNPARLKKLAESKKAK